MTREIYFIFPRNINLFYFFLFLLKIELFYSQTLLITVGFAVFYLNKKFLKEEFICELTGELSCGIIKKKHKNISCTL